MEIWDFKLEGRVPSDAARSYFSSTSLLSFG